MKKLLCLLVVLAALMGVLVIDLGRDPGGEVELAGRVETSGPSTAERPPARSSSAAELQRVIRQGAE